MVEVPDSLMRLLPLDRGDGRGERAQKGCAVNRSAGTPGFFGYTSLLALAIVGMSGLYVGSVPDRTTTDRFLKPTALGAVHDQYTVREPSGNVVAAGISPDVVILIGQHRAALAGLTMPVPGTHVICR